MYEQGTHVAYVVGLIKYPAGSLAGTNTTALYDTSVTTIGTLVTQADVTLNGHAARSFTCTKSGATIKGVIVLVGDDLYMVYVVYDATVTDTTAIDAFIADFALTV
jgi:hypothetical protein